MRSLVVGEALVDAVTPLCGPTVEHVGGSPANVAFGVAALGHDVDLATWVGPDARGRRIEEVCRSHRVRLTPGSRGAERTSVAHARLDASGAASYDFDLEWQLADVDELGQYGHVHTGSIAAVLAPGAATVHDTITAARVTGTVSYDPNTRPSLMGDPEDARRAIEETIGRADVVKASDEDLAWLYPGAVSVDVLRAWTRLGPPLFVLTRGAAGVLVLIDDELVELPAPAVTVLDTVGAGDAFMAGLLSGLLDSQLVGSPPARERLARADFDEVSPAVDRGLAAAAWTVARRGAQAPTRAQLGTYPPEPHVRARFRR